MANTVTAVANSGYPLDLDSFEEAILNDFLAEWTADKVFIPAIIPEFQREVRLDLIRLEAWFQLQHEPYLFMVFHGPDYQPFVNMQRYCERYSRYHGIRFLQVDDDAFLDDLAAAKSVGAKTIIILPVEAFPRLPFHYAVRGLVPDIQPWHNFMEFMQTFDHDSTVPAIVYNMPEDSVFVRVAPHHLLLSVVFNRTISAE